MPRKRRNFEKELLEMLAASPDTIQPELLSSISAILRSDWLLSKLFSLIISKERDTYLNDDSANGFYPRTIQTKLGLLSPSVPRTRNNKFRPKILPEAHFRHDKSVGELLEALIIDCKQVEGVKENGLIGKYFVYTRLGCPEGFVLFRG